MCRCVPCRSAWSSGVCDSYEAKVAAEVDVIVATLRRFGSEIEQVRFEAGALTGI